MFKRGCVVLFVALASACGGSNSTTSPTPTPTATTFSLSGTVTDSTTASGISGVTVTVADGVNAGKSTTTSSSGSYSFTGLLQSGFTVNVSATNYLTQSKSVTLTSNQTLSFSLAPVFPNLIGGWTGTWSTTVAGGVTNVCNNSWLVTSQSGAAFSGTWQTLGGNPFPTACASAGTLTGTVSQPNAISGLVFTSTVGAGCTRTVGDGRFSGALSGSVITVQMFDTVQCPGEPTAIRSSTISMRKQ
jgi:hypothetical protein